MTEPMPCAKCGQPHAKCKAHKRSGGPCGQRKLAGQEVCRMHGGKTPVALAAAERRVTEQQARAEVVLFGARRDIHPADALLELVQWTAGEVDYWRSRVRLLDEAALTWGVTRVKEGGEDRGTTEEAKPHVAYSMLVDASNRLERYSASALKAGVDERRVRLAEQQGTLLHGVLVAVLGELGHDVAPGSVAAQVILRHMAPLREGVEGTCQHKNAQPVTLSTGEVVAAVCPSCMAQLSPMALEAGGAA